MHPARPEPRSRAWLPAPAFAALAAALVAVTSHAAAFAEHLPAVRVYQRLT